VVSVLIRVHIRAVIPVPKDEALTAADTIEISQRHLPSNDDEEFYFGAKLFHSANWPTPENILRQDHQKSYFM
jgi:hypothetical protein